MTDLAILGLRVAFVLLLYLFLGLIGLVIWRDLRGDRLAQTPTSHGPVLRVLDGARSNLRRGELIPLVDQVTIGRSAELQIADESVSASHASLHREGGRWWIEDLGSTNGTQVNGRPVSISTVVMPGDEIRLGRVRLRLEARS